MRSRLTGSLAAGLFLLAGCGVEVSGTPSGASSAPADPEGVALPAAEECADPDVYARWTEYCANVDGGSSAESSSAPAAAPNPRFGETYTYENGLAVTVGPPQPYTPSDSAAVGEPAPPAFVVFDVTVVNGTTGNYDPVSFSASLQSGVTEEEQVYDSANGIGGTPSTTLLPGRESVFRLAFGATDPADLVMEVSPSFEYESAIFTS
ncbi:hypothetical protein [Geodermatophilus sp. SYSU D00079]